MNMFGDYESVLDAYPLLGATKTLQGNYFSLLTVVNK